MQIKNTLAARLRPLLTKRHGGILLFLLVYLGLSAVTRLALLGKAAGDVAWNASLLAAAGWGLLFDLAAGAWIAVPLIIILTLPPARFFQRNWARLLTVGFCLALLFGVVAEWVFWDEFSTRFNFIAVDYIVYTDEVIGNIWESYSWGNIN